MAQPFNGRFFFPIPKLWVPLGKGEGCCAPAGVAASATPEAGPPAEMGAESDMILTMRLSAHLTGLRLNMQRLRDKASFTFLQLLT